MYPTRLYVHVCIYMSYPLKLTNFRCCVVTIIIMLGVCVCVCLWFNFLVDLYIYSLAYIHMGMHASVVLLSVWTNTIESNTQLGTCQLFPACFPFSCKKITQLPWCCRGKLTVKAENGSICVYEQWRNLINRKCVIAIRVSHRGWVGEGGGGGLWDIPPHRLI